MNDQKDIHKTKMHSYGHRDVSEHNPLDTKASYEFANKKTEKLVTALYMVTDCMDTDDALKGKLRLVAVELLSDMHKLSILSPLEKHASIEVALSRIAEILSFVEIAHTIGFVSEMNGNIIKKEFHLLVAELKSYQSENQGASFGGTLFESKKNSSFNLDEKMFEVDETFPEITNIAPERKVSHQDIKDKKTPFTMSFTNKKMFPIVSPLKRLGTGDSIVRSKEDRQAKILSLIKDKKEISIKDISGAFLDCSEKTIQRELNALVAKGQIQKIGEKRWSRYAVIV